MTLHTKLRGIFEEAYLKETEQEYYWVAKDAKNLKLLINKIKFSYGKKNNEEATDENIEDSFRIILEKLPDWYKEHMEIAIINSRYNSVIQEIKKKYVRSYTEKNFVKSKFVKWGNN